MSTFEVLIRPVDDVLDHPNADRLNLIRILGYEAISNKTEEGLPRHQKGDLIAYIPEASLVPEDVLKEYGYWNTDKDCGMLAGKAGNRVKAIRLRGIISQGLVLKLERGSMNGNLDVPMLRRGDALRKVEEGDDISEFLGITKYEPPIPMGMGGEVASVYEFAMGYDIENEQNFPGFLDNDEVEATEKLHGTCFRVSYRPTVKHDEMFGDGDVAIASKGLGEKGLVFKNNEANNGNVYVRTARELDLPAKVKALGERMGVTVDLLGEIFGAGVQDLHYGTKKPEFRAFDINLGGTFAGADLKAELFDELGVERVPVLYRGPFDRDILVGHRDGKTTLGGSCIREGIVVTAVGDQAKRQSDERHALRPILKMVSPDYLTRKGNDLTEYN